MADEEARKPTQRTRTTLSEMAGDTIEGDLWNLDDDFESRQPDLSASAPSDPAKGRPPEALDHAEGSDSPTAAASAVMAPGEAKGEEAGVLLAEAGSARENRPRPRKMMDVVGLVLLAVVMLGLATWVFRGFSKGVQTGSRYGELPEMPFRSELATVAKVETYWRHPVREGEDKDFARGEVNMIPVVAVTLKESSKGVVRVIFRDHKGRSVGDAISRDFSGGKFSATGNMTAEFPATDGLREEADFHHYRVSEERWTAEVFEGPAMEALGSQFKKLFSLPVSAIEQE